MANSPQPTRAGAIDVTDLVQPHPTGPAGVDASGAAAAARLTLLHHVQVGGFALIALIVAAMSLWFLSALDREDSRRNVVSEANYEVSRVFDRLRQIQLSLPRLDTRPGDAVPLMLQAAQDRALIGKLAASTAGVVSTPTREGGEALLRHYDEVMVKARELMSRRATGEAANFSTALTPDATRLAVVGNRWVKQLEGERIASNERVRDLLATARRVALITALVLLGVAVGFGLLIGRERARVVAGLRLTLREQAALREVATSATWAETHGDVADITAREIRRYLEPDHVRVVSETGENADERRSIALPPAAELPEAVRATQHAAEARATALDGPCLMADQDEGCATAAIPYGTAPCRGMITATWTSSPPPPDVLASLARIGSTLGLAAQSVLSRERLTQQAITDALTGLPNHRAFQERLAGEVASAHGAGRALSLILLDVDGFSNVNDAYGHEEGDRILGELGQRLRGLSRADDTLARIGGEEFAWLMPGVDATAAAAAANRARDAVRNRALGQATQLTVSAGIVDLTHAQDAKDLLRLADVALRDAKSTGQDAVAAYRPGISREHEPGDRFGRLQSLSALRALARAVDMRDDNTQRHSERVAGLTHRLAIEMGWTPRRAAHLQEAALVHDVGKVGVPDAILLKPGALTQEERLIMETHPSLGARIVSEILDEEQVAWVRGHHERVDGEGYPDGLRGDALSEGARIMAVADTWDAMTSDRPYRRALDREKAVSICIEVAGAQLDPDVVAALVRLHRARVPETLGHDSRTGMLLHPGGEIAVAEHAATGPPPPPAADTPDDAEQEPTAP